jgi:hypothetical protein
MTAFHSRSRVSRADVCCSTSVTVGLFVDNVLSALQSARRYVCGWPWHAVRIPGGEPPRGPGAACTHIGFPVARLSSASTSPSETLEAFGRPSSYESGNDGLRPRSSATGEAVIQRVSSHRSSSTTVPLDRSLGGFPNSRFFVQCPSRACGWRAGLGTHNPSTVNVRSSSIERVQPVTLRYHSLDGLFMRVECEPIVCERSRRQ